MATAAELGQMDSNAHQNPLKSWTPELGASNIRKDDQTHCSVNVAGRYAGWTGGKQALLNLQHCTATVSRIDSVLTQCYDALGRGGVLPRPRGQAVINYVANMWQQCMHAHMT